MSFTCRAIGSSRDKVGESPLWDAQQGALYWVDAAGRTFQRYSPAQDRYERWETPAPAAAFTLDHRGNPVLVMQDGFYRFDLDDNRCVPIELPESGNPKVRFNDGKADRQGRFIAGTAVQGGVDSALGALYRLNVNLTVDLLDRDIMISNGPCFSPDGTRLYFSDSMRHQIYVYDYDIADGAISNKRVFVDTHSYGSIPDGATVDRDGCVWVALLEVGRLAKFDCFGKLDRIVELPIRYPTSVMFGGENLDTLFVTSISHSLSGRFIDTGPNGGALFAITGLGSIGIPEHRFGG